MYFENSRRGQSSIMIGGVVVLVVIIIGVAYFMMQKDSSNTTSTQQTVPSPTTVVEQPTVQPETTETESKTEGKKVTIQVDGSKFKFAPSTITVNQGDTVTVKFNNIEGFHDFVLDEFNVKTKQLAEGKSEDVTFVASKKGTFEYYCSVGNHRQMGMKGTLTVK